MNEEMISVIVPIYKVERYLKKCVNSILAQSYSNLEIILVDDGSPDGCPQMCDQFAKEDSRIVVVHKKNGGLSSARNAGIDVAHGGYIGFVDSDDWCEPNMFEMLYNALRETDCSISICGIERNEENGKRLNESCLKPGKKVVQQEQALSYFFDGSSLPAWACNKLFKKTLWKDVRFPLNRQFEDIPVTRHFLMHERSIAVVPCVLYHYLTRTDSISGTSINVNFWLLMQEIEENVRLSREVYGGRFDKESRSNLVGHSYHFMRKIVVSNNRKLWGKIPSLLENVKSNKNYIRYARNLKTLDKFFATLMCVGASPVVIFRFRKLLVCILSRCSI